jgi:hypothetical protein
MNRICHLAVYLTPEELERLDYARGVLGGTRARIVRDSVLSAIERACEAAKEKEAASTSQKQNATEGA